MMKAEELGDVSDELLDTLVAIETLKLKQKQLLKEASTLGVIALVIIGLGAYASISGWTQFPIFQGTIAAGGILLAIAFRPLQQCKKQIEMHKKELRELDSLLKKNNLEYKADVRVTRNQKGEYNVKKSIKLITVKK